MVNHFSECSKLAQTAYKTRHDWVEKVIHRELCKKIKFDPTTKWYMHKPESVQNEIVCDFQIQTDYLIPAWRLCRPDVPQINKKKDKYLDLARELRKLWNMKVTVMPIITGAFGMISKGFVRTLEELEIRGRAETIQTTTLLSSARILRRVLETWGNSVTQAPMRNHQLTLV